MKQKTMTTDEKVQSCLEYIDDRLENTSEQTLHIAETIIDDIKLLHKNYKHAIKAHTLREHADLVHDTQMKWVNQLQRIILDQNNQEMNSMVIKALQNFANNLNKKQIKQLDFDLPKEVTFQYNNGKTPKKSAALPFNHLVNNSQNPTQH